MNINVANVIEVLKLKSKSVLILFYRTQVNLELIASLLIKQMMTNNRLKLIHGLI